MVPELKRTLPATPSGYFDDPEIPRQVSQPALRDDPRLQVLRAKVGLPQ